MKIILHQPNGVSVTFTDCELLQTYPPDSRGVWHLPSGNWLRFKGTNDIGKRSVITTSLRAEIYET